MRRSSLRSARLQDGSSAVCVNRLETKLLEQHVEGYFNLGIDWTNVRVVFDVGANIGLFGKAVLAHAPQASVYAFEPVPELFAALAANAARGAGRWRAFPLAIWDRPEEIELTYLPRATMLSSTGSAFWNDRGQLLERIFVAQLRRAPASLAWTRHLPTPVIHQWARALLGKRLPRRCRAEALSNVIDELGIHAVDLLKIDCEGAEDRILSGIAMRHWPIIRRLVVEVHDLGSGMLETTTERLRRFGFDVVVHEEPSLADTGLFTLVARRPLA